MAATASANPARRRSWPAPNGSPKTSITCAHSAGRSQRPDSGRRPRLEPLHGADGRRRCRMPIFSAVLTYIRQSWGNKNGAVSVDEMKAARAAISGNAPSAADLAKMTPLERGHVFSKYGCFQCHGQDARGRRGQSQRQNGGTNSSLIYVADGYTKDELKSFIMRASVPFPCCTRTSRHRRISCLPGAMSSAPTNSTIWLTISSA